MNFDPLLLLVEDDPDHTQLILDSLQEQQVGARTEHVWDGQAALDYLSEAVETPRRREIPHLLLLDMRLPKVNGLAVLKQIRSLMSLRNMPVVMLTTSASPADVDAAYAQGADSYLVKPFEFHKFCDVLDDLGLSWFRWNRSADDGPRR